jgi:type IV pilus assembly protein PilB
MENMMINNEEIIFDELTEVNMDCTKLIPRDFALNNSVFPFQMKNNELYVAMRDTNNDELVERLRLLTRRNVVPCRAKEKQIHLALKNFYEKAEVENTVEDLKRIFRVEDSMETDSISKFAELENSPIIRLTDFIITEAIIKGASDIHIEPQEDKVLIRFRVDGLLFDAFNLPNDIYRAVITRIKVISDMDISEKRMPQDGKTIYRAGEGKYDLRISSLPTVYGEKIVIRVLYKSLQRSDLKNLKFNIEDYELMKKALKHNHGMLLVTGPTGSGKSSTLYAMLNEINSREKNITTIEDPVEISISGINQVNVNSKAGINFASGLRSILRQDPDVILIGEIRDEETAAIAVRAAITGHLVLSTLHTNDSVSAINRLSEMGIPIYLLGDAIVQIISQRLVRKICSNCRITYDSSQKEKQILGLKSEKLHKGKGCPKCNFTGYSGRQAVCEVLHIDDRFRRMILRNENDVSLREYLKKTKMRFLTDNCRDLVIKGITTFDEYIRLCNGEIIVEEAEE